MASINLNNVKKSYGKVHVIHGVNMDIENGEFVVIVGSSGCGKSTLLRMIAGLETISDGEISIGERVVNKLEPAQRDIAMVFQNYALYPHMTVYKNIAYGLKIRGFSKDDIDQKVKEAAEILQLGPLLQRKPKELSGGQRQRVAMGRAIVRRPQAFLFDEPLSNLDAKLRTQMRIEIKRLHNRMGVTSIYVTHDQVEAMTLATRLVVMNAGYAEQIGSPKEVYDKPATVFVAGFIGSPAMNFLSATISDDGSQAILEGGQPFSLPEGGYKNHAGKAVILGIRPEHLEIAGSSGDNDTLTITMELAEELGADTLLHGTRDNDPEQTIVARLPGHSQWNPDQQVTLRVRDRDFLHLFDAESKKRLE